MNRLPPRSGQVSKRPIETALNLLFTNHGLDLRGGTELFTAEVVAALADRGHRVAVFASESGAVGEMLEEASIPVLSDPAHCPFVPQLIHGQHHLQAMAAMAAWPDTPGVFMMHGTGPWEEKPPVHPRLVRYLAPSSHFGWWLEQETGVSRSRLSVIRNFFDAERFTRVRPAGEKTGKALFFHNSIGPESRTWHEVEKACVAVGLELKSIGREFGRIVTAPEQHLADFEVVFAAGRSAIEAIASGCTVIPVNRDRAAARAHPEILDALIDLNFAPDANHHQIEADGLIGELKRIRPEETEEVTRRVRTELNREAVLTRLLGIYEGVREEFSGAVDESSESAAFSSYLVSLGEKVRGVDAARAELAAQKQRAADRAERWKKRAEMAESRLDWLEERMEAGPPWRGRLWRRLRREWERKDS